MFSIKQEVVEKTAQCGLMNSLSRDIKRLYTNTVQTNAVNLKNTI